VKSDRPLLVSALSIRRAVTKVPKGWNRASTGHKSANIAKEEKLGLFSRDIKTMDDLFLHAIRDIYYAEKQLVKKLIAMAEGGLNRRAA
jgi:hypothetical protein